MTCLKVEVNHISSIWKKTFWANKIKKKLYVFSEVDPMRPTLSSVCTRMKSAKPNSVWFTLYTFRHNKCWQLTWMVDQVQKYTFEPSSLFTKNIQTKRHGPSSTVTVVNKNGGASLRNRGTNSWRVPRCSAVPVVMQWPWAVPLSARRQSSSAAAMWPRSRLCSCTMREKHEASTHFSSQTCLPSRSSKKRHRSKQEKW